MIQTKTVQGVVRGATIELAEDLGIAEGQRVVVQVSVEVPEKWGAGLERCAGALASDWTPEDDAILELLHRERQADK